MHWFKACSLQFALTFLTAGCLSTPAAPSFPSTADLDAQMTDTYAEQDAADGRSGHVADSQSDGPLDLDADLSDVSDTSLSDVSVLADVRDAKPDALLAPDQGPADAQQDAARGPETCDGRDNDGDGDFDENNVCECEPSNVDGIWACDAKVTWEKALEICGLYDGFALAMLKSEEKNLALLESLQEQRDGSRVNERYWIGLSDRASEGQFVWIDDTPIAPNSYTRWMQTSGAIEPNDLPPGEDCVELSLRASIEESGWNDIGCEREKRFLCGQVPD